jgi:hypothetical protein
MIHVQMNIQEHLVCLNYLLIFKFPFILASAPLAAGIFALVLEAK